VTAQLVRNPATQLAACQRTCALMSAACTHSLLVASVKCVECASKHRARSLGRLLASVDAFNIPSPLGEGTHREATAQGCTAQDCSKTAAASHGSSWLADICSSLVSSAGPGCQYY
jgi:hypothetical protein